MHVKNYAPNKWKLGRILNMLCNMSLNEQDLEGEEVGSEF